MIDKARELGWIVGASTPASASVGALFHIGEWPPCKSGWHNAVIGFHLLAQRSAAFETHRFQNCEPRCSRIILHRIDLGYQLSSEGCAFGQQFASAKVLTSAE